jgi:CRISPR system Cascade subunit CasD
MTSMHKFIVFRLYGPLAAWGDIAVGELRSTTPQPSKSAVLGLVAAALGIDRSDDQRHLDLARGFGFAVRVDAPGVPLRDYHTSQRAKSTARLRHLQTRRDELADRQNRATSLSTRDYRTDAVYTVGLHARQQPDAPTSEAIATALARPRFPLYLGRRSCPLALPVDAHVIDAPDLPSAFAGYDEAAALLSIVAERLSPTPPKDAVYYWEDGIPTGALLPQSSTPRYDQPRSRVRRQFAPRPEHRTG